MRKICNILYVMALSSLLVFGITYLPSISQYTLSDADYTKRYEQMQQAFLPLVEDTGITEKDFTIMFTKDDLIHKTVRQDKEKVVYDYLQELLKKQHTSLDDTFVEEAVLAVTSIYEQYIPITQELQFIISFRLYTFIFCLISSIALLILLLLRKKQISS